MLILAISCQLSVISYQEGYDSQTTDNGTRNKEPRTKNQEPRRKNKE